MQPECAGQPCIFTSTSRGVCCGDQCVDPGGQGNCGGCGNFCSSGVICAPYSTIIGIVPPLVTGACLGCPMKCPAGQTCGTLPGAPGYGCVCHADSDCLMGQQCLLLGQDAGACWYPP
jgi:hypothetical protein